jgi:hypothetical protein
MMVQNRIKIVGVAAACAMLAGCASTDLQTSPASCPHCVDETTAEETASSFVTEWLSPDRRPAPVTGLKEGVVERPARRARGDEFHLHPV